MLFAPEEKGQGLVEYALIIILIAIVLVVTVALIGDGLNKMYSNIASSI
jgi:pilus assembly protein Flp/PilA